MEMGREFHVEMDNGDLYCPGCGERIGTVEDSSLPISHGNCGSRIEVVAGERREVR